MKTRLQVPYTYLTQQFAPDGALARDVMREIGLELEHGRFTLGPAVDRLEEAWARLCGVKHAVGVNSGTDALKLIIEALYLQGETVQTAPNTFVATVGAIREAGAIPRFRDIDDRFLMPSDTFSSRRPKWFTIPVHWGGDVVSVPEGEKHRVIEDACQAVGALDASGRRAGALGIAAAFSLHPLKNVNVWGDGGMVTTDDDGIAAEVKLLRNHGLKDRDTVVRFGHNSRLDTIQAIVGYHALKQLDEVTQRRRENAARYDAGLGDTPQITVPPRVLGARHVYHLYQVEVEDRDALLRHLIAMGIEAKIHYPIPLHLQPVFNGLYADGSFPRAEAFARNHITLPVHQFLAADQIDYVIECVRDFYRE